MTDDIEDMTKPQAAKAVGKLLDEKIIESGGSTITKESWTNVLHHLIENGTGKGPKYHTLTKPEVAAAVGGILSVETTRSNGSTVTENSWKNVLRELRQRHNVS